ncbi:MAG: hypothetical protein IT460_09030 [Planctomycetes bacterium]|nr:hypothetical protein [Planctomycetota bacterium]
MRLSERGMSMWPFVICLVLLLAFVFLWFSEKGEHEKATEEVAKLKLDVVAKDTELSEYDKWVREITAAVGFSSKTLGSQKTQVTDVETLVKAINPDGDGPIKALRDAAVVKATKGLITPKSGAATSTEVNLAKLSSEFKDKVKAARDAFPGQLPAMPDDPDDAGEMAKWKAAKEEYDRKFDAYVKQLTELAQMKEWAEYKAVIGATTLFDPEKTEIVAWNFWAKPAVANATVEDLLPVAPQIVKDIVATFSERVNALLSDIAGHQKTIEELKKTIDNGDAASLGLKQQLEAVQKQLAEDTAKLQAEAAKARSDLETIRVAQTTAEQALAREKDERKAEVATLNQTVRAYENAQRENKERKDLAIQRDDPDGLVLEADANLLVGYINLGTADKVYAGVKFRVSTMGRGAIRETKGEVIVTKVLDAHYSQVRILSTVDASHPIGRGDMIANPFFDAKAPVHVFIAGDLRKYPKSVAASRLQAMGCIVDDAVNVKTDFIVIPDSVAAGTSAPAEGDAAAAGASEYDKLMQLAKSFGATLATERMLEAFLGY